MRRYVLLAVLAAACSVCSVVYASQSREGSEVNTSANRSQGRNTPTLLSQSATPRTVLRNSADVRPYTFTGTVVRIADGDTFFVQPDNSDTVQHIRLWGVDTPQRNQPYGSEATEFTEQFVTGKKVTVEVRSTFRSGQRLLGWVSVDGKALNLELLRRGLAWWYRPVWPEAREIESVELAANRQRVGLWQDAEPTPPWQWRQSEGRPARERRGADLPL